jgi:DNA invertase Pin-like site-specific DNA recombinase
LNGNLYGYVRSSADSRDIEKQMIAIWDYGVAAENVYVEKKTAGNDSDTAYNTVVDMLKDNDTLVIASLDVLGDDCYELMDRWRYITITKRAGIIVLDLPLANTGIEEEALGKVVARITLGVMQHFDQSRQYKKQKQAEGIAEARRRGVRLGRKPKDIPKGFEEVRLQWDRGEISARHAASALHVDPNTFRKWVREAERTV